MSTLLPVVPLAVIAERHFEYAPGDEEAYTYQEVRKDPNQFLLEMPRGSYTGMRTIERTSIMDLSGHISRLSTSLSLIHVVPTEQILPVPPVTSPKPVPAENARLGEPGEIAAAFAQFRDSNKLEGLLVPLLKKGLERYYQVEEGSDGMESVSGQETKVTVLIGWECKAAKREMAWNRKIRMTVHFCPLQEPPAGRCQVEIHGDPRTTATAKDSQWVRDRKSLEDSKDPETNEVVLTDPNTHDVYEGMSSNFFAVVPASLLSPGRSGSVVVSAPLHAVLEGTILKLVVAACEKLKIPFEWRFPNVGDVEQWEGAFITSTSRLVLPIERIRFRDDKRQVLLPKQCGLVDEIRRQVIIGLKEKAYRIL